MKYVERIRKMILDQMQQESVNVYLFGSWPEEHSVAVQMWI